MEPPRGAGKPLHQRRARSWDRSQKPRKDPTSQEGQYLSLPVTPPRPAPADRARPGSRPLDGPGSEEALSPEAAGAPLPGEEQRPPRDRKDRPGRGQQGWLKTVLNFFARTGPEEAKDKAGRRARAREGPPPPTEPAEPAPGRKAHDKKARRRHGHRRHGDGDTPGTPGLDAGGREAAAAQSPQEAARGPGPRGGEDADPQRSTLIGGRDAGASEPSSQAPGPWTEEELQNLDSDTIIQMIVQLLQEVGDKWDEEVREFLSCPPQRQGLQREEAPPNPAPAVRKKSQERKPSFRRSSSHKKHSSEEPRRAGAADAPSPEPRPPKRPSFLYLCVGGHRASISSSVDSEEPEVQEASSAGCGGPSPLELPAHPRRREPGGDLPPPDKASECKEFIQKIVALLQDAEEQEAEKHPQVQEPEAALETPAPPCRKKSQEKKSSFRKAFSHKKHGSKEPKRAGAAGAASPEPRRPRRPTHLALCIGGHRPSISSSVDPEEGPESRETSPAEGGRVGCSESPSQAGSHEPEGRPLQDGAKELLIQQLVALLPRVDGHLGEQIRRHPSLKKFFYQLPDPSLRKLAATLHRRSARCPQRPYQFAFDLANKFAGSNGHPTLSLMGLRYPQLPHTEAQQNTTSLDFQSPD